jgi:acyl-CoA synthetase (AMP-forming)/AMP-acid ligase II
VDVPEIDFLPTMPAAIRRAAADFADRELLVMPDRRMTYAEADAASRRVAKDLLAAGVGKGTRVGIMFTWSPEWVVAWLAITRIGGLLVPFASTMKPPELLRALRHSDVAHLMVPPTLLDTDMFAFVERAVPGLAESGPGPHFLSEVPFLREVWVSGSHDRPWASRIDLSTAADDGSSARHVTDELLDAVEREVVPSDLMVVVYTSGATSDPKGVVHTHASQLRHGANLARNYADGFHREDRIYCSLPFFWIGGLTVILMTALHVGSTILCTERFEAEAALDLIEDEKANRVIGWPPAIVGLSQHPTFASRGLAHVSGLAPPPGVPADPDARHRSLGMSETSGPHTAPRPGERIHILPDELRGSFGAPLPAVHHRIVDPDEGTDVLPGEVGEILVRGYSLMDGLYKRERHDVFDEDGWYHTGDRGLFRDGYLIFLGRLTEMIKTAGANVAPREVEMAIESHPDVDMALVVGLPDEDRGELVTAVVVPEPGATIDVDALTSQLREDIATYKVPRRFVLVTRADVPWLPTGKPDKRLLKEHLLSAERDTRTSPIPATRTN